MKKFALLMIFCSLATTIAAEDGWNESMNLFKHHTVTNNNGFRIPAITTTSQGTIIAVTDVRYGGTSGNTDMPQKVDFMVKTSNDGGTTWSEGTIIAPTGGITDPAIVHDPNTGKTFLFGYQNDKNISVSNGKSDFFVYSSDDGGKTWDNGTSIKNETLPEGYKYILQGPGSGMYYNGTIYMAVQAWHGDADGGNGLRCSSGFIYSEDGGKTWQSSELISSAGAPWTSESNIFHHNGKIYLAAKDEQNSPGHYPEGSNARVVYSSSDNGKTWQKETEDFLPDNVAKCETSTFTLNDDVYLVGYALQGTQNWDRKNIYITTNTGRKIQLWEGDSYGYTSMAQDLDNLYVLFEAESTKGDVLFRRFDIASKEYANVNAQILERGQSLLNNQNKLFASRTYLGGEYSNNSGNKAEAVVLNGNYKIGAFHEKTSENSKDVYRTLEYKTEETTLILSQDNVVTNNDNIFIGYQYTDLEYTNKSKNDINSFVIGYSLEHNIENSYTYHLALNGIYSNNKLKRNNFEGVGRTADFDSYSLSLKNELSKEMELLNNINTKISFGVDTTIFGHDKIDEEGGIKTVDGGKWNNATVDKSKNISNEFYVNTELNKNIEINEKLTLEFGTNFEYRKELMNVDDWRDDFTVLDVTKKYARPVEKHNAGVLYAGISAGIDISDKIETTVSYTMDSTGDNIFTGKMIYKF